MEELVKAIQDGREQPVELWLCLQKFIRSIAFKYQGIADLEDLVQESYFGMLSAIRLYDPKTGPFKAYCHYWINQAMLQYISNNRSSIRVPVNQAYMTRKYRKTVSDFNRELHRDPTDKEVCEILGVSFEQLKLIKATDNIMQIGSLDTPLSEDTEATVGDMVPDESVHIEDDILEQVNHEQLQDALWGIVDQLPKRQAEVIRRRYQDGQTQKEVGEALGVSGNMARSIEVDALRKLRSSKIRKQLQPWLDDIRYSYGTRGGKHDFERTGMSSTEFSAFKAMTWEERLKELGL